MNKISLILFLFSFSINVYADQAQFDEKVLLLTKKSQDCLDTHVSVSNECIELIKYEDSITHGLSLGYWRQICTVKGYINKSNRKDIEKMINILVKAHILIFK